MSRIFEKTFFLAVVAFILVLFNAYLVEAKPLKKGEVYHSSTSGKVIEVISGDELEIKGSYSTRAFNYGFKGDKLRVLIDGSVDYYLIVKEGLKEEEGGEIYYSRAFLATKFKDNGNGTVTDNYTKLMWQQGRSGQMQWDMTFSYCNGLSLAGYNDWRVPNLEQLIKSLRTLSINHKPFPNFGDANVFWSSNTQDNGFGVSVGYMNFHGGRGTAGYTTKSDSAWVRCVRLGGQ